MTHVSPETPNRCEPEASSPLAYFAGPLFSQAERQINLAVGSPEAWIGNSSVSVGNSSVSGAAM
jgi:hypothetical protein